MKAEKPLNSLLTGDYVVIVDDDSTARLKIEKILHCKVVPFTDVPHLLHRANHLSPKAAFIDIHLNGTQLGTEAIPTLRQLWPYSAIFVITSDHTGSHVKTALSVGADDYISKPFDPLELSARYQLRVNDRKRLQDLYRIGLGDLTLDTKHYFLEGPHGSIQLSRMNSLLLECLMLANESPVEKDLIKQEVWKGISISDNAVDKRVSELRSVVREYSSCVDLVSVYARGYRLSVR